MKFFSISLLNVFVMVQWPGDSVKVGFHWWLTESPSFSEQRETCNADKAQGNFLMSTDTIISRWRSPDLIRLTSVLLEFL